MSKESISGKIKTILSPETEIEELQKKREAAKGIFFSQQELDSPTKDTLQKIEGLLDEVKKKLNPPPPIDHEANNRRFGAK